MSILDTDHSLQRFFFMKCDLDLFCNNLKTSADFNHAKNQHNVFSLPLKCEEFLSFSFVSPNSMVEMVGNVMVWGVCEREVLFCKYRDLLLVGGRRHVGIGVRGA